MIKKLFGYTVAGIAFIAIIFFSYYKGYLISYTNLWLILSMMVFLIAFYVAATIKTKKEIVTSLNDSNRRDKLIATGEKIRLDIDSCEIKENDYYEEIPNQGAMEMRSIDALFDPNENYKEKYIDQSAIIYLHKIGDKTEKYISQVFPFGTEVLTLHILNNDIILYVDRFDRNNYLFDLNEKLT